MKKLIGTTLALVLVISSFLFFGSVNRASADESKILELGSPQPVSNIFRAMTQASGDLRSPFFPSKVKANPQYMNDLMDIL